MTKGNLLLTVGYNGGEAWECSRCAHKNWKWQKECASCGKRRTKKDKDA